MAGNEHSTTPMRAKVMVVDDEPLIRMTTADMLEDLGYDVIDAANGHQVLERLKSGEHFDILVTDQSMPGMSGEELAAAIKQARPQVGVLLISGYSEIKGLAADVVRLNKPFGQHELAKSMELLSK